MRITHATASALAIMTLSGPASGDEVRWINPAGGEWNDAANWEPAQVPQDFDDVIFDLDATYTVTVCGKRPKAWRSLKIDNSKITFDLCGEIFISRPSNVYGQTDALMDFGTDSSVPTDVSFVNGMLFDPQSRLEDYFYAHLHVGKAGLPKTRLFMEDEAVWGGGTPPLFEDNYFAGDSELYSNAPLNLNNTPLSFGPDTYVEISEDVQIGEGIYSGLYIGGEADLYATIRSWDDALLAGQGTLRMHDGSRIQVNYVFDLKIVFEGSASISAWCQGLLLDFRGAAGDGVRVDSWNDRLSESTVIYGPGNREHTPTVQVDGGYLSEIFDCEFRYESDKPVQLGSAELIGYWEMLIGTPGAGQVIDVDMIIDTPGHDTGIMRWGTTEIDPSPPRNLTTLGVYILGVPDDWCTADLDLNGVLNFFDIARFIDEYNAGSAWANINNDVFVNEDDVMEFIAVFSAGCP